MNTKKILFALAAMLVLAVSACTPNTADDDQLYEQGLNKKDVVLKK